MDRDIDAEVALRLLDFVDRMADLVGVCDEEGRVLYLNETARKYLGFGDTANLTTADFFGPDVFQWYYDEVRPILLKTGRVVRRPPDPDPRRRLGPDVVLGRCRASRPVARSPGS